mmetsp:Transcript_20261/g.45940  ORF Transcript_20261/g.45940 Transcript_20261/m.45940 type:complete len:285 (+) Transcript_20261:148-1002(+)
MFHDTLSSHIHQLPQRRQYVHGPLPRQRLHSQGRISKLRRPLSIPLQRHPIIGRMRGHVPRERRDLPKPPRLQEHPRHQRRLDPHGSPVWTPPSLRILRPPPQVSQQQLVDGRGQGLGVLRPAIAGGVRRLLLQLAAEGIDDVISVVGAGGAEAGDGHRDGGRDAGGGELVDGGWGGGDLHGGHEVVAEDRGVGAGGAVGSGPYDAVVVGRVDAFAGSVVCGRVSGWDRDIMRHGTPEYANENSANINTFFSQATDGKKRIGAAGGSGAGKNARFSIVSRAGKT